MVTIELAKPTGVVIDKAPQQLAERPIAEGVDISIFYRDGNAKLLQGKSPEQLSFLEFVVSERIKVRDGKMTLEQSRKYPNGKEMAQTLKRELGVIHKAIPVMEMNLRIPGSSLGVHGEVKLGEVNNPEGIIR